MHKIMIQAYTAVQLHALGHAAMMATVPVLIHATNAATLALISLTTASRIYVQDALSTIQGRSAFLLRIQETEMWIQIGTMIARCVQQAAAD